MTTLIEQIEAMRMRMNELANEEYRLVKTLEDTLASADQQLLEEVRGVAAAHSIRRGVILEELQALARYMCVLPGPAKPFAVPPAALQQQSSPQERQLRDAGSLQNEIASYLRIRAK